MSFALWLVVGVSVAGLLYLRWKEPDLPRPIRVPLFLPIIFLACCVFLVLVPVITNPLETGIYYNLIFTKFINLLADDKAKNDFYFRIWSFYCPLRDTNLFHYRQQRKSTPLTTMVW